DDFKARQFQSVLAPPREVLQIRGGFPINPDGSQELREERSNGEAIHEVTKSAGPGYMDQVIHNPDGTIHRTKHLIRQFDQYRNWIKITLHTVTGVLKDFETVDTNYRTFTYYEKQ